MHDICLNYHDCKTLGSVGWAGDNKFNFKPDSPLKIRIGIILYVNSAIVLLKI